MLPVSRPSIGAEELEAVRHVFDSGWLGLGSAVFAFEERLKAYLGARHVIAVNTGTSALHIALAAYGVARGDEVIVPSLTFCASVQAIMAVGAVPVFCEVSPRTLNLDVADVERRLTPRTRAVMPVHYCGQACDMDALLALGRARGVAIVEDAAHAIGSTYKGRRIGGFGDCTCLSFDPIKNLTCGEGGAVALSDDALAEEILRKRILGIDKDTWHRYRNERAWFYEVTTPGFRYHMGNINAAIGLVQLGKLEAFCARKREIVAAYNRAFAGLPGIALLDWNLEDTAPFAYILRVLGGRREAAIEALRARGVGTGIHYIPNHTQPLFRPFATPLPITEQLGEEILTLPLFQDMTPGEVEQVVDAVESFSQQERRAPLRAAR